MSKYGFPKLPRPDIIEYLEEANIATEADLLKPKPDFVQNLYTKILFRLVSLQEDHEQVDFRCVGTAREPRPPRELGPDHESVREGQGYFDCYGVSREFLPEGFDKAR
ncbi:hypothetical protein Acr_06g0004670 [Actinidia rufa]|uniref:Kinetochore protein Nuf2 N-terminal domain-containing protein n=1 Tax=Actinidia rufa TaxID=165716 RepID=A0A7J0ESJ9_9ERIC|nr:hypothetical protein Acr_06g0004670 [Actinidia rufa]